MAKNNKANRDPDGTISGTAVADKETPVSDFTASNNGDERSYEDRSYGAAESGAPSRGFFDIYKPGQGFYTRVWSGVAYGTLALWLAFFLYEKLSVIGSGGSTTKYIQVGVAVGTVMTLGLLGYWMLALNRRIGDFLIATEGEMKKVNWTSRKEIIGSTKVVVFVVVVTGVLLFVVDVFFMLFFNAIGILKGAKIF